MTATQALRRERRRQRELQRRQDVRDAITGALVIVIILALLAIAGTMDYHDDQMQLAYWAERGVIVQRW